MTAPTVSVVMPAYNRSRLIGASIRSVLAQTRGDFELLVIDDGSTDDTVDVVRRFDDPRIRLLRAEHRGIAAASNQGVRAARARYIARVDSDDLWEPTFLEVQLDRLERDPSIGLVYAMARIMNGMGALIDATWGYAPRYPDDILGSLVYDDCVCNITVVVRTEHIVTAGYYDETLSANVDWDMWLRVARVTRFAFTPQVLAVARVHGQATTHPDSPLFTRKILDRKRVLDKVYASASLPPSVVALKPVAYRNMHTNEGLYWLAIGRYGNALRAFRAATQTGAGEVPSGARVIALLLADRVLSRYALGRKLMRAQAKVRRRIDALARQRSARHGGHGRVRA
jgi:glycosyltransferase involved in cell wall biosynthesis